VKKTRTAGDFLQDLEQKVKRTMPVQPHRGKEFWMTRQELRERYPADCRGSVRTLKRRYDPHNLFSNAFTERVFGW